MSLAAGLLALALIGADVPRSVPGSPITYQVRVLEFDGPGWRGAAHASLTPISRQGGASVWTAPKSLRSTLEEQAGRTVGAPSLTSAEGARATVHTGTERAYVADLKRHADGPVGHATALAYRPEIGQIKDGVSLTVEGRWMDQGLLTQVQIEEQRLIGLLTYDLRETVQSRDPAEKPSVVVSQIQTPEVVTSRVDGEWLIPHDGLLVVSLGVSRPGLEADAKAPLLERVVLIETAERSIAPSAPAPAQTGPTVRIDLPPLPIAASGLPTTPPATVVSGPVVARRILSTAAAVHAQAALQTAPLAEAPRRVAPQPGRPLAVAANAGAMPAVPDRRLPLAVDARGEVVQPELPAVEEEPADASAEPRATPQFRTRLTPAPPPPDVDEPTATTSEPLAREQVARTPVRPAAVSDKATCPAGSDHACCQDSKATQLACCEENEADGGEDDAEANAAWIDQVVAAVRQYARTGEACEEPVCVFEIPGEQGRLRVLIEADAQGQKRLQRALAPNPTRDSSTRQASHTTGAEATPKPKFCCPGDDACDEAEDDACGPEPECDEQPSCHTPTAIVAAPEAVRGFSFKLSAGPESGRRVEGKVSVSFRLLRQGTTRATATETTTLVRADAADDVTVCPATAGVAAMAISAPRDPALTPVAAEPKAPAPRRRLMVALTPAPIAPIFSAQPLVIRVPVGMHGMVEVSGADSPGAGLQRFLAW